MKRKNNSADRDKKIFMLLDLELDLHLKIQGSLQKVKEDESSNASEYGTYFSSVTSEKKKIRYQAENLFEALKRTKKYFVVILPNNDPGCEDIKLIIQKLDRKYFKFYHQCDLTIFQN